MLGGSADWFANRMKLVCESDELGLSLVFEVRVRSSGKERAGLEKRGDMH